VTPRGAGAYVRERLQLDGFPMLAARIPELRRTRLVAGLFLSARTAAFDGAVAGIAAAAASRSALPLAAAVPYAAMLARRSLESGSRAPVVAPVELAADAAGLVALLGGSLRHGSPVL
jgi:hypothetical protein